MQARLIIEQEQLHQFLTAQELNSSVPELAKIANIDARVLFSEYSENIMPEHWLQIAKKLMKF